MKAVHWRLIIIVGVIVSAAFYAWPRPESGRPVMNMRLGLDLKGGTHLVMKVVTDEALKSEADLVATRVGDRLRKEGFPNVTAVVADDVFGAFDVGGIDSARLADARALIDEEVGSWGVSRRGDGLRVSIPSTEEAFVRDRAVRQALNTIRNRVDEFGVAEPLIQRIGGTESERILVQLPGVEDPSRVKDLLNIEARLELRLLHYGPDGNPFIGPDEASVISQLGGSVPPGVEVLPEIPVGETRELQSYMAVSRSAAVTGGDLQDARPAQGEWGDQVVSFTLRVSAASRFGAFTKDNVGRRMAIILDDEIKSAPNIIGSISTHGQIEGSFTFEEADTLALVLRAGALPAPVRTIEERTVGPSLGHDSIVSGASAAILGFVLVMLFMVVYYKIAGINAVVALLMNLLIVAAVMAVLEATLTLPGIGGFILTVGMAVDANVLIFERIREELRSGKTVRGSLDAGFSKALSAILDANITTLIAALFLFQYGTGPVRGFAVTLSIGILASIFTAIFVSRTLFDLYLGERVAHKLSI